MTKRDYYEVLGVSRDADREEIKKAYRQAALKYHPDRNLGNKEVEERFKEASEAYEALSDPETRRRYDQFGHAGLSGTGFHPFTDVEDIFASFGDLFDEFFGLGGVGRARGRARRGADLSLEVEVALQEAYAGVERTVEIERQEHCASCNGSGAASGTGRRTCPQCRGSGQVGRSRGFFMIATTCDECRGEGTTLTDPCRDCRGTGRVRRQRKLHLKIPPGVETGTQLLLRGEGEAGAGRGDLYVFVRVRPDPMFTREGTTLTTDVSISFPVAALGGEVEVPTMTRPSRIQVPRGMETGETVVLEGQGFPHLHSKKRGDLVVRFIVKTPKHLNKREEELLRGLAEISGEAVRPKKKGLFS